jgi:Domain of unknown function (DUF4276)
MAVRIVCVVEGHGETASVPILVRRIAAAIDPAISVDIGHIRVSKSKLVKHGELERAVALAAMRSENGGIVVVLDADDDCPAQLGPSLLARVRNTRPDRPSTVVLANREFESWFLASAESLRGHRKLPAGLESPQDPEAIRGAKEWLSDRIGGGVYSPTVDQAGLTSAFDLTQAKRAPSFDKCYREIVRLLEELRRRAGE